MVGGAVSGGAVGGTVGGTVTVTVGGSVRAAVGGTVVFATVDGGLDEVVASVVGAPVGGATFAVAFDEEPPHAAVRRKMASAAIGTERVIRVLIVTASVAPEPRDPTTNRSARPWLDVYQVLPEQQRCYVGLTPFDAFDARLTPRAVLATTVKV